MSEFLSSPDGEPYDPTTDEFGWQDAYSGSGEDSILDGPIEPAPQFVGYARFPQLADEVVVVLDNGVMYADGENGDVFYLN